MKAKIKKQLIAALRSGEYEQGNGCLKNGNNFCCLGVLCDIYRKENEGKFKAEWFPKDDGEIFLGETEILPQSVLDWAGMNSADGEFELSCKDAKKLDGYYNTSLVELNDSRHPFEEIADFIKKYGSKI